MGQSKTKIYMLEAETGHFCVRAQHGKVVPAGNYSGSGCGGFFVAQSLQDCKTIRSVNYNPFRSYGLDIRITVLCTWNTLALKLIIRSFPALFCVRIGKVSFMLCLSRIGLRSGHADMGLSKILSHGEERKAPQLSELLRQPQEHELSVTGVTTAVGA